MLISRLSTKEHRAISTSTIAGPDASTKCPNPSCVGASLWYVKGRRDADGRIVGWEGRCVLCCQVTELPTKKHLVTVGRLAPC